MKIYAVRHGQTDWNAMNKVQGKTDIPLNATGREQARETAGKLSNLGIDIIISSPLMRAAETAEIIAQHIGVDTIEYDKRLTERDFGDYEGKPFADLDIAALRKWTVNAKVPNGETIREAAARVFACLDETLHKYTGRTILYVAHGHILRAVLWYFNGIPEDEEPAFGIENCAVYEFDKINKLPAQKRGCGNKVPPYTQNGG